MANQNTNATQKGSDPSPTASSSAAPGQRTEAFAKIGDQIGENIESIAGGVRGQGGRMAGDTMSRANQYYDDATTWLQQNYGKTLAVVGVLAAVGLVGWLVSRSLNGSAYDDRGADEF